MLSERRLGRELATLLGAGQPVLTGGSDPFPTVCLLVDCYRKEEGGGRERREREEGERGGRGGRERRERVEGERGGRRERELRPIPVSSTADAHSHRAVPAQCLYFQ